MNIRITVGAIATTLLLSACGEENKEYWQVWRASGPGAGVILKQGVANEFWIRPVKRAGKVVYYDVGFEGDKMTDNWKGVILHPRGSVDYDGWPQAQQLDPWDSTLTGPAMAAQEAQYQNTIDTVLAAHPLNTSHSRLEGDVLVEGVAESLRLVVVKNALKNGTPLLLVELIDTRPGSPIQSGSASGDPR